MSMTSKVSALSIVSILLVASTVFLGNQRQAYANEASLGEQIVCDVFTELGTYPLPPGAEHCEDAVPDVPEEGEGTGEEEVSPVIPQCADGLDNDGDGFTDFLPVLGDSDCENINDDNEGTPMCAEGQVWNGTQCVPEDVPVDVCPNLEGAQAEVPAGHTLVEGQCVPDVVVVDVCPNIEGNQVVVPEGKQIVDGACVDLPTNGYSQGSYGGGSYSQGSYGGGGNGPIAGSAFAFPVAPLGVVLGASTTGSEVTATTTDASLSCDQYLTAFIKPEGENDAAQVTRLQSFLNEFEGTQLELSGEYDNETVGAVHAFQTKHAATILTPWGIEQSTGYVYLTTRKAVNDIRCAGLGVTFPLSADEAMVIEKSKSHVTEAPASEPRATTLQALEPVKSDDEQLEEEGGEETETSESPVNSSWSPIRNFLRSIFQRE